MRVHHRTDQLRICDRAPPGLRLGRPGRQPSVCQLSERAFHADNPGVNIKAAPLRGAEPGVSARLGLDEARLAHAGPHRLAPA